MPVKVLQNRKNSRNAIHTKTNIDKKSYTDNSHANRYSALQEDNKIEEELEDIIHKTGWRNAQCNYFVIREC